MVETNPIEIPKIPIPTVSKTTLPIGGLQVDVYGLSELTPAITQVSCLWLHHPRLRRKEDMADTAHLIVSGFNHKAAKAAAASGSGQKSNRGLIAVAFDQRNHGTRMMDELSNEAWRQGNKRHAQDMFSTISGTVMDTIHLLDVVESYLFPERSQPGGPPPRRIDQNLVLGVSLGGHSAWQLLFSEPRVIAGVCIIGCPDYMRKL